MTRISRRCQRPSDSQLGPLAGTPHDQIRLVAVWLARFGPDSKANPRHRDVRMASTQRWRSQTLLVIASERGGPIHLGSSAAAGADQSVRMAFELLAGVAIGADCVSRYQLDP